ncbi:hypothetical protein ACFU9X_12775 [Streptomyces atratus]|uniref:hypothetical protein n=1 Tax=Streptomyces atratus TaxID=1893 RepID=UPI0036BA8CF3
MARILDTQLGGTGLATWTSPKGGYFVTFEVPDGCAKPGHRAMVRQEGGVSSHCRADASFQGVSVHAPACRNVLGEMRLAYTVNTFHVPSRSGDVRRAGRISERSGQYPGDRS